MHARLVDDHVRALGQAVLGVLDPPAADDLRAVRGIRLPEDRFVDPVRLLEQALAEPEGPEHLDGAAGHAVGLAKLERAWPALDDSGLDVGESGQLCREDETGRTATDDEDVHFVRETLRRRHGIRGGRKHARVADRVAVEIELHASVLSVQL